MTKENNKVDINKHEIDIDTLKKQNVNDLLSIKELYKRIEELGEKTTQIKYIDNTLIKKFKKEYENFKKIILDENIQVKLSNDIKTINSQMVTKANKSDIKTINSQLDNIDTVLSNYKVANVKDFGAIGDGVADDTHSIKSAIKSLENISCASKGLENGVPAKRAMYGGGKLLFPSGIYKVSSQLDLNPLIEITGAGNVVIEVDKNATEFESVFNLGDMTSKYNLFDVNGVNFSNLIILCNRKAKTGIKLLRTISNYIKNVKIYGANEDGLILETCQWTELSAVEVHGSGRHGFVITDTDNSGNSLPSANISMVRCQANKNGQIVEGHGIYIKSSNVSMTNCTSGHNGVSIADDTHFTDRKNCGIYMTGTHSKFCSFTGGHLEQNYYHVLVEGGHNFKIDSTYFVKDNVELPKRFVVNNGCENLIVVNSGSQDGTAYGENDIDCPYEVNFDKVNCALFIIGGNAKSTAQKEIICYREKDVLKVLSMKNSIWKGRCGVITNVYDGLAVYGLAFSSPDNSNFPINYLRLGSSFYWDNDGKLYSRKGRIPKSLEDGVIVGSQS